MSHTWRHTAALGLNPGLAIEQRVRAIGAKQEAEASVHAQQFPGRVSAEALARATREAPTDQETRDIQLARLQAIRAKQARFPGRKPGGSGLTGLMSSDARGWSAMLNEQTEAENLERALRGQSPLAVRYGGELGGMSESIADAPAWWLQGTPGEGATMDNPARVAQNASRMPASLHGLYGESLTRKNRR